MLSSHKNPRMMSILRSKPCHRTDLGWAHVRVVAHSTHSRALPPLSAQSLAQSHAPIKSHFLNLSLLSCLSCSCWSELEVLNIINWEIRAFISSIDTAHWKKKKKVDRIDGFFVRVYNNDHFFCLHSSISPDQSKHTSRLVCGRGEIPVKISIYSPNIRFDP